MPSKLKIITKESEVDELIQHCITTGYASFDFETTGLKFKNPEETLLILGVSFQPGSSWIIPLGHKDSPFKDKWLRIFRKFGKEVIENPNIIKVCWNFKFEYKWCMRYDIFPKGRLFDSMLAKYLLDEESPHDLKSFVKTMFPEFAGYEKNLKGDDNYVDWKNTDYRDLCKYCGIDCDTTLRGMILMEPKLIKNGFYSMFRNMLMMATRVLAEIEYRGLLVDRKYLEELMKIYDIKVANKQGELKKDPALLKYEKKYRKEHLQQLIDKVRLEIAQIKKDEPKNANVIINNREKKINNITNGILSNKDKWESINFGSPKQIRNFFFESKFGLRLKPFKYTKDKKTGQRTDTPSTDEESLLALAPKDKTGFMAKLLELRGLEKLNSTYITGMHPHLDIWDRIHAGFKIPGTVTGRLSCTNPNLQNIPRGTTAADIKRMFIPPPGYLMLEPDYGQAELRIIAEQSGDEAMIDIFKRNYNIHVATACKLPVPKGTPTKLKGLKDYEKIKKIIKEGDALGGKELEKPEHEEKLFWVKQKKKGKSLNFSIVYQQGDDATAITLECSKAEAHQFKRDWFKAFPKVEKWIKKQINFAHNHEYVKNIFGTKRRLHDINSGVFWMEAEAERQAVNAPIQGGSGYFTLFSMVIIRDKILRGELPRDLLMTYTVHDSIGFYIKPEDIHFVVPKLEEICNNPQTLKYFGFELKHVRMKISTEVGKHWEGLKDYDEKEDYTKWVK